MQATLELMNVEDYQIIIKHKNQFISVLKKFIDLSKKHISIEEITYNEKFQIIVNELKKIEEQGLKSQFLLFTELILGGDNI